MDNIMILIAISSQRNYPILLAIASYMEKLFIVKIAIFCCISAHSMEFITYRGSIIAHAGMQAASGIENFDNFTPGTCNDVLGAGPHEFVVTQSGDHGPGSLRAALQNAGSIGGGRVSFAKNMAGATIVLARPLRPPSRVTIDGGCRRITLSGPPNLNLIVLRDVVNVSIRQIRFEKPPYTEKAKEARDAISIIGMIDNVFIEMNRFSSCGDGCIDATRLIGPGQLVIQRNLFQNHNKAILIATCFNPSECASDRARTEEGIFLVKLDSNVFAGTGQRHPKAIGLVRVEARRNLILYRRFTYSDGSLSASYGMSAAEGAILILDQNAFAYLGPELPTVSQFAARSEGNPAGQLAGEDNIVLRGETAPGSRRATQQEFERAASCIVARLGQPGIC